MKLTIEINNSDNPREVRDAFHSIWGLYKRGRKLYIAKGGDKHMAYDVTALTSAIAEGKADEVAARQLIADFYNWEIKVAQLLNPSDGAVNANPVADFQPAVETQPTETVDLGAEAQPESEQTETQV